MVYRHPPTCPLSPPFPLPSPFLFSLSKSSSRYSSVVPRLIEDMVPMPPDTLALEQLREAKTSRNLILMHEFITVFWFANDELTDLERRDELA